MTALLGSTAIGRVLHLYPYVPAPTWQELAQMLRTPRPSDYYDQPRFIYWTETARLQRSTWLSLEKFVEARRIMDRHGA